MSAPILAIGFPLRTPGGALLDAADSTSLLTRAIRAVPEFGGAKVVSLPMLTDGVGLMEFLVSHTLGSFIEVEATAANGKQTIAPFGIAGDDGNVGVIELARIIGVPNSNVPATSFGVGELVQDILDEGAFSVVLTGGSTIAADGGLGLAAALGVTFFDASDQALDLSKPFAVSSINRIDASNRPFQLLTSRFFLTHERSQCSPELLQDLSRIADIVRRDVGREVDLTTLSESGIEFGIQAFFNLEIKEVGEIVAEVTDVTVLAQSASRGYVLVDEFADLEQSTLLNLIREAMPVGPDTLTILVRSTPESASQLPLCSLADVPLFQAPLTVTSDLTAVRRDISMRLEKAFQQIVVAPQV